MESHFEIIGYNLDIYVDKKYVGSVLNVEKDRSVFGYAGRISSTLTESLRLKKKKVLAGTEIVTELIPLCGKQIK